MTEEDHLLSTAPVLCYWHVKKHEEENVFDVMSAAQISDALWWATCILCGRLLSAGTTVFRQFLLKSASSLHNWTHKKSLSSRSSLSLPTYSSLQGHFEIFMLVTFLFGDWSQKVNVLSERSLGGTSKWPLLGLGTFHSTGTGRVGLDQATKQDFAILFLPREIFSRDHFLAWSCKTSCSAR